MEVNPYAPPQADLYAPSQDSEAETIRKMHLSTEGGLQLIGGLLLLGAFFVFLSLLSMLPDLGRGRSNEGVIIAVLLVFILAQGWVGFSLRKLKPQSRWPATGLTALGLLGFPIGTVISLYFLYILNNKRGKFILSPEYQAIRDATPHIKRKTSRVLLIILGILLLLLAGLAIWSLVLQ